MLYYSHTTIIKYMEDNAMLDNNVENYNKKITSPLTEIFLSHTHEILQNCVCTFSPAKTAASLYGDWSDILHSLIMFLSAAPNEFSDALYSTPFIPNIMPTISRAEGLIHYDIVNIKNTITPYMISNTCILIKPLLPETIKSSEEYIMSHFHYIQSEFDVMKQIDAYCLTIEKLLHSPNKESFKALLPFKDTIAYISAYMTYKYASELLDCINAREFNLNAPMEDFIKRDYGDEHIKMFRDYFNKGISVLRSYNKAEDNKYNLAGDLGRNYIIGTDSYILTPFTNIMLVDWTSLLNIAELAETGYSKMDRHYLDENSPYTYFSGEHEVKNFCDNYKDVANDFNNDLSYPINDDASLTAKCMQIHKNIRDYKDNALHLIESFTENSKTDIFRYLVENGIQLLCISDCYKDSVDIMLAHNGNTRINTGIFYNNSLDNGSLVLSIVDNNEALFLSKAQNPYVTSIIDALLLHLPQWTIRHDELSESLENCLSSLNTVFESFALKNGFLYPAYSEQSNSIINSYLSHFCSNEEMLLAYEYVMLYTWYNNSPSTLYNQLKKLFIMSIDDDYPAELIGYDFEEYDDDAICHFRNFFKESVFTIINILSPANHTMQHKISRLKALTDCYRNFADEN